MINYDVDLPNLTKVTVGDYSFCIAAEVRLISI